MYIIGNDANSGAAPIVGNTAVTLNLLMTSALVTAGSSGELR